MSEIDPEKQRVIQLTAKKFKKIRLELKMTQTHMAEMLSFDTGDPVDVKSISLWEKGERKLPGWALVRAEILRDEFNRTNTRVLAKGAVIKNKKSLLSAMIDRVKELLQSL